MKDAEIALLSQNIEKLKSLKHLKLHFEELIFFMIEIISIDSFEKLSDKGLQALGKALKELVKIESVDLRLLRPE